MKNALSFHDEVLGPQTVSLRALVGADQFAGSLIVVEPNDRVRIRAQGRWVMSRATGTLRKEQWPRPLQLKATVTLAGKGIMRIIDASKGTVPVLLRTLQG